jgi:hypothetical protein
MNRCSRWPRPRRPRPTARSSDALPVKPGVLEVLDLLRQVVPVPHQFQISVSSLQVFGFLRYGVAFYRLYPEPFGSRRHQNQRGAIRLVPLNSLRSALSRLSAVSCSAGRYQEIKPIPTRSSRARRDGQRVPRQLCRPCRATGATAAGARSRCAFAGARLPVRSATVRSARTPRARSRQYHQSTAASRARGPKSAIRRQCRRYRSTRTAAATRRVGVFERDRDKRRRLGRGIQPDGDAAIGGDRQVHGHPHAGERTAQHHPFAMQIDNAQAFVRRFIGGRKTRGQ